MTVLTVTAEWLKITTPHVDIKYLNKLNGFEVGGFNIRYVAILNDCVDSVVAQTWSLPGGGVEFLFGLILLKQPKVVNLLSYRIKCR